MRWAAHASDFAGLAFAVLARGSAALLIPATGLAALLVAFLLARAVVARRRLELQPAPPAPYAPYALPARVAVALAAAARARR